MSHLSAHFVAGISAGLPSITVGGAIGARDICRHVFRIFLSSTQNLSDLFLKEHFRIG